MFLLRAMAGRRNLNPSVSMHVYRDIHVCIPLCICICVCVCNLTVYTYIVIHACSDKDPEKALFQEDTTSSQVSGSQAPNVLAANMSMNLCAYLGRYMHRTFMCIYVCMFRCPRHPGATLLSTFAYASCYVVCYGPSELPVTSSLSNCRMPALLSLPVSSL